METKPEEIKEDDVRSKALDIYINTTYGLIDAIIKKEMEKNNFASSGTIVEIEKKKTILTIVFSIINFVFLHFLFLSSS